jgi:hypothetical protein
MPATTICNSLTRLSDITERNSSGRLAVRGPVHNVGPLFYWQRLRGRGGPERFEPSGSKESA